MGRFVINMGVEGDYLGRDMVKWEDLGFWVFRVSLRGWGLIRWRR